MKLKVGAVQFDVEAGAINGNIEKADQMIDTLATKGCELAVLPEMWSCGFYYKDLKKAALRSDFVINRVSATAKKNFIFIAGSLPEFSDGKIFNTMYIVSSSGEIISKYRKVHLFTVTGEDNHFAAGENYKITNIAGLNTGLMICYDLRFPELGRTLAVNGAKLILISAQWPDARVEHWKTLLQARAIENQVYIVAANRSGSDSEIEYAGNSCIISPGGEILKLAGKKEASIMTEIDSCVIDDFRKKMPCLNERKKEVYDL